MEPQSTGSVGQLFHQLHIPEQTSEEAAVNCFDGRWKLVKMVLLSLVVKVKTESHGTDKNRIHHLWWQEKILQEGEDLDATWREKPNI